MSLSHGSSALAGLEKACAVEHLIQALRIASFELQADAALALGRLGDRRAVEPLIAALDAVKNNKLRRNAARALALLGDVRAVDRLVIMLLSDDLWLRHDCVEAIERLGDVRAVNPLIRMLGDNLSGTRTAAAQALATLGCAEWKELIKEKTFPPARR
jgi:HEAT repeat protein